MSDILDRIYAAKAAALDAEEEREPYADGRRARAGAARANGVRFARHSRARAGPAIVAEIKRASPSVGLDRARLRSRRGSRADYEAAGADAISVLTEARPLSRRPRLSRSWRARTASLPLLRKDFSAHALPSRASGRVRRGRDPADRRRARPTHDSSQLLGRSRALRARRARRSARRAGADARARARARRSSGINNRDLRTFETDLAVTGRLLPLVPSAIAVISESGVQRRARRRARCTRPARAPFLIGESADARRRTRRELVRALASARAAVPASARARASRSAACTSVDDASGRSTPAPTRSASILADVAAPGRARRRCARSRAAFRRSSRSSAWS